MPRDDVDALFFYDQAPPQGFVPMLSPDEMCRVFDVTAAQPLGRGSFGETWRLSGGAAAANSDIAAKVIIRQDYPANRLAREVEGLQRTMSANVVRLIETRQVCLGIGRRAVLLCEFVAGGDVGSAIAAGCRPTYQQVHEFAVGVLTGVAAMHLTGTVHRDVKPENIALRDGDWAQPVLLDLGLAKMLDADTLTAYPSLLGTLPFMAPEQIRLEEARKGADVWAVGVVLHLLLSGTHPFFGPKSEGVYRQAALARVTAGAPDLPVDVPEPLRFVAQRLLKAAPYERGSAARALGDLTSSNRPARGRR